ncbi:MAG: DNA alkylation repair protein [Gemmatimonadales bacterium]
MTTQAARVREVLGWLERRDSARTREEMRTRYGITAPKAYGVSVGTIQQLAKQLGRDHELAAALWATGWYEARMLTAFIDDPEQVTAAQMDRWAADFDNWGICDTLCFNLFDRTPLAWKQLEPWSRRREEFVKRAAFALLAGLALHDKAAADAPFLRGLKLVEREAQDERNFVRKGVSWALRVVGRRNQALNEAAVEVSKRLADADAPAAQWVGRGALRELTGSVVRRKLAVAGKRSTKATGTRPRTSKRGAR